MRNRFGLTLATLLLAASSLAAQAPAEKETASATPAGATFTVPAGWKTTGSADRALDRSGTASAESLASSPPVLGPAML